MVEVVDWEVHSFDTPLVIIAAHPWPVYTAVSMVNLCLYVENASDTSIGHTLDILLSLRIGSNENVLITDLLESKVANEVSIALLYVSIDQIDLVDIFPFEHGVRNVICVSWLTLFVGCVLLRWHDPELP